MSESPEPGASQSEAHMHGSPPGRPGSLDPAQEAELAVLADDYRVGNLDVAGRTRLVVLLAARDGRLERTEDAIRTHCALNLPGCLGTLDPANAEIDHILPQSKGGATVAENLQVLCASCNRAKRSALP